MIRLNTAGIATMADGASRTMRINYDATLGTLNEATHHMKSSHYIGKNQS
jgi:hypothetical protein